ncbi:cation transporter [Mesobacillus foraminis]|uniref:cation diffusion facilitator family transporter n=1 Tax=Mesobacillus foraminis TaxID=279826 RepID=UPI001BE89E53|nr:cation diffusion facilitator family transporter [Mesobacillus foraminis]MBT2755162.1 cation transporter [Mesobacillus foraminis]
MGHHHHGHGHHHGNCNKKALFLSFVLISMFMVVEVIGGIWTNSLALLSDAGHMFSDAVALGLSFFAIKLGERTATKSKTYGYKRFEIIAAAMNGLTLIGISLYIFWEAYHRLTSPPQVQSLGMLAIAVTGFLVNIVAAWILMKGDKDENLNVRSAFLHVIGDLLGSAGAIIAALLIYFLGWTLADPIASVIVAVLVLVSGLRVAKEAFHILMEGAPPQIEMEKLKTALGQIPYVKGVHDLHIWSITSEVPMLSCHLAVESESRQHLVLHQAVSILHDHFGIEHCTIQVETEGCPSHHGTCN